MYDIGSHRYFCCVDTAARAARKCRGHAFSVKMNKFNVKSLIYNAYAIQSIRNISVLILPYDWYNLSGP